MRSRRSRRRRGRRGRLGARPSRTPMFMLSRTAAARLLEPASPLRQEPQLPPQPGFPVPVGGADDASVLAADSSTEAGPAPAASDWPSFDRRLRIDRRFGSDRDAFRPCSGAGRRGRGAGLTVFGCRRMHVGIATGDGVGWFLGSDSPSAVRINAVVLFRIRPGVCGGRLTRGSPSPGVGARSGLGFRLRRGRLGSAAGNRRQRFFVQLRAPSRLRAEPHEHYPRPATSGKHRLQVRVLGCGFGRDPVSGGRAGGCYLRSRRVAWRIADLRPSRVVGSIFVRVFRLLDDRMVVRLAASLASRSRRRPRLGFVVHILAGRLCLAGLLGCQLSWLNWVPSAMISATSSSVSRQAVPLPIATTPTL